MKPLLALLLLASLSFGVSRSTFLGVRAMGMGSAYTACADDASAMYLNPAGLDLFTEHMQLTANVAFYVSTSISDKLSFAANQGDKLTNPEGIKSLDNQFYDDLYDLDGEWSTLGLIPNVAFMARTLDLTYGASYYWNIPTRVMIESGVLIPKIFIGTKMDQIMTFSAARRFFRMFSIGASLKWVDRYVVDDIALGYTETLEFIDKFKGTTSEQIDALDPFLDHQYGPGLDLGFLFHFGALRAGLSLQDALAYVGKDFLSPRLNIGLACKVLALMESKLVDDATLTLDFQDVSRYANFLTKLNMGAEVRLNNFDFRGGIHQGYAVWGSTLHFFVFRIDYLYNVDERGIYTGSLPLPYHLIQLGADIKF